MSELLTPGKQVSVAEPATQADCLTRTGSGYRILHQVLGDVQQQGCPEEGFYAYSHHIDRWDKDWSNSMDDD